MAPPRAAVGRVSCCTPPISVLLRAFGVSDPSSTSLLGVGLLAVIALLFLINVLMSWWMVLVIPLVAAGTFALAHWVTTAFVETTDG